MLLAAAVATLALEAVVDNVVRLLKASQFVEGPAEILNRLEPSEIYGIIDLSESEPGSYQIKPKPVIPNEITVLQQWPTVSLWVKPERIEAEQEDVLDLFR